MWDKVVNDILPPLKLDPDWFVANKMIKKLHNALLADDDILFFDEDSGNVIFSSDEMGIFSVDFNNINLDNVNFDKDDPKTIIHVRLITWYNRLKQRKSFKTDMSKELMPVAWHPTRWWDWCNPEDEKKEIEPTFTDKN